MLKKLWQLGRKVCIVFCSYLSKFQLYKLQYRIITYGSLFEKTIEKRFQIYIIFIIQSLLNYL